jgi:putative ABC transport system permease protein
MSLRFRLLESGCRAIVRLAPAHVRDAWGDDLQLTFRDACVEAQRRHGIIGLARIGVSELFDLVRASLRARLGHRLPITGGNPPHRPARKGRSPMQTILNDLRLAMRSLLASRVPSGIAIFTLALGIGVNAAIFSVLDSLLFRPFPFAQADRLVEVTNFAEKAKVSFGDFKRDLLLEWQKQTDLFDRIEAYGVEAAIFKGPNGAQTVNSTFVSPGLLPILGVAPVAGRLFVEGDGREGTDAQVVISERFWRESLGSIEPVIGSQITINDRPHTVIGMMPATFYFPNRSQDIWLPVDPREPPASRLPRFSMTAFARLAPGLSFDQAVGRVQERGRGLSSATKGEAGITATIIPRSRVADKRTRQSLIVLGGAVVFLLLIVCANIANLSLSRTLARSRDFAIKSAMGASRRDLIRETVVENLVIGVIGAVIGLGIAWLALNAASTFIPQEMTFQSLNRIDLDGRTLVFTMVAGLLTCLLFGLPPAIIGSRPSILGVLRLDSRSLAGSTSARRLRSGLVIAEVTVAIVLLVGAALMSRSYLKLQSVDRGFNSDGLISLRLGLPSDSYADSRVRDRFSDTLVAELRQLPGVVGASVGTVPPDASLISFDKVEIADAPGQLSDELVVPIYKVWPSYFSTLGLPIKEGRGFTNDEPRDSVIISESFARKYWPDRSPIGKTFRGEGSPTWLTVVGVATEVRQLSLDDSEGAFEWYQPLRIAPGVVVKPRVTTAAIIEYRSFVVRATDTAAVLAQLSQAAHKLDSRVVVWKTTVVNDRYAEAVARPRVTLLLLLAFSGMGLVLAAAGLYGVLSHLVTQRLREIGIRLALGAKPERVFQLILRNGLSLTMIGLFLGLGASYYLVRVMRSILYEVEPSDPVAIVAVSVLLVLTAIAACWRPARRAMKVDPVSLLREQ